VDFSLPEVDPEFTIGYSALEPSGNFCGTDLLIQKNPPPLLLGEVCQFFTGWFMVRPSLELSF